MVCLSLILAPILIAIKYSNKLSQLLKMKKEQAKVNGNQLVPWKSGGTLNENYSAKVPHNMITLGKLIPTCSLLYYLHFERYCRY